MCTERIRFAARIRSAKLQFSRRKGGVSWRELSVAVAATAAYAILATQSALRIVNPVVIQDEYVYYISGLNLTNLDRLYSNAPTFPRFNNYIYFLAVYLTSQVVNAADLALKAVQIASVALTAWTVIALIYFSSYKKTSELPDSSQNPQLPLPLLLLLLLLWPSNTYAMFVMPDLLYFDLFLVAFSLSVSAITSWQGQVAVFGCTAGLLMHVKPHALFLFVALLAAIVGMKLMRWSSLTVISVFKAIAIACVSFGTVFALTRGLFRLAVTLPGTDLIGTTYTNYVVNTLIILYRTLPNLAPLHLIFFASTLMIVGPCLIYVPWVLFKSTGFRATGTPEVPAHLAFPSVFCVVCWLVLVSSLPILIYEESSRINLRYLAFTFPALVVSAVVLQTWVREKVQKGNAEWAETLRLKWAMALTWSAAAVYLAWHVDHVLFVDAPDLYSLDRSLFRSSMPWVSASIIVVASGLIILQPRSWLRTYMCATVVLFFFAILNVTTVERRISDSWREFRKLGEWASLICPNPEKTTFLAMPDSYAPLYSAAFGFKGPARFLFVANPAAEEAQKAVTESECIIALLGTVPELKPRRLNARGLELQW